MTAADQIVRRDAASFGPQRQTAISQATAIEQQRAIAEVQAAVIVAQSCPRDMAEAEREMEYVCGRLDMAEQAFYQVTNRGTGPSVHLMRELARIWGNVDYGVRELARNDERGESEVQAFAWDQQRNTRSSRTFINPHQRMVKVNGVQQRKDLTDLQDIYLSNNNIGARAVRECVAAILPRWFTEKAQNICHNTLRHGEGKPLQERIASLVKAFEGLGISEKQLEARLEKKRGAWTPEDLAQLTVAGQSIRRGEAQKDDLFPPIEAESASTADEIAPKAEEKPKATRTRKPRAKSETEPKTDGGTATVDPDGEATANAAEAAEANPESTQLTPQEETRAGASDTNEVDTQGEQESTTAGTDPGPQQSDLQKSAREQLNNGIFAIFGELKLNDDAQRPDRLVVIRHIVGREVQSSKELTDAELQKLRNGLFDRNKSGVLDADVTEWLNEETLRQENLAAQEGNEG